MHRGLLDINNLLSQCGLLWVEETGGAVPAAVGPHDRAVIHRFQEPTCPDEIQGVCMTFVVHRMDK